MGWGQKGKFVFFLARKTRAGGKKGILTTREGIKALIDAFAIQLYRILNFGIFSFR